MKKKIEINWRSMNFGIEYAAYASKCLSLLEMLRPHTHMHTNTNEWFVRRWAVQWQMTTTLIGSSLSPSRCLWWWCNCSDMEFICDAWIFEKLFCAHNFHVRQTNRSTRSSTRNATRLFLLFWCHLRHQWKGWCCTSLTIDESICFVNKCDWKRRYPFFEFFFWIEC